MRPHLRWKLGRVCGRHFIKNTSSIGREERREVDPFADSDRVALSIGRLKDRCDETLRTRVSRPLTCDEEENATRKRADVDAGS